MSRILAAVLIAAATLSAGGRVFRMPSPDSLTVQAVQWHLRAVPDEYQGGRWGIRWHTGDTAVCGFAEIVHPGADGTDNISGTQLTVTVGHIAGDTTAVDGTWRLGMEPYPGRGWRGGMSMRLRTDAGGATLAIGRSGAALTLTPPITAGTLRRLESYADTTVDVLLDSLRMTSVPAPQYTDASAAIARAAGGGDPRQSLWTYFDRDTDPLRSRLGGRYELVSAADSAGCVRLIYLGGADDCADDWRPGRVKAELHPTLIPGVYDLTWYCPDGTAISRDAGATIEQHLLTVQFPDRRATIRFRRR